MAVIERIAGLTGSAAVKPPCAAATTAAITLSALQTIDGVALTVDDRVLVKNQADTTQNGIWLASMGAWTRAQDFDGARDVVNGTIVIVIGGTLNGNKVWKLTATNPVTIDVSALTFTTIFSFSEATTISTFMLTLLDDTTAAEALTTLGFSAFFQTLIGSANAAALRTLLGLGALAVLNTVGTAQIDDGSVTAAKLAASISGGIAGMTRNLRITNGGTPDTDIALTADDVIATNGSNLLTSGALSKTISSGSTGANGLDAGSIGNDTWYAVFAIAKADGTWAGLLSTSETSPTMPSGYTFKVRLGWVRTDGSANFLRTVQAGNRAQYQVTATSNTDVMPIMASGTAGTVGTPVWAAVDVSDYAPPTAVAIVGVLRGPNNAVAMAAPNDAYGAYTSTANTPPVTLSGNVTNVAVPFRFILESANVYWASNAAGGVLAVLGWEDI